MIINSLEEVIFKKERRILIVNRLRSECLKCIGQKEIEKYPPTATEEEKIAYIKEVFNILVNAKPSDSGPSIAEKLNKLKLDMFNMENPYIKIKPYFNDFMMRFVDKVKANLAKSENPLLLAIQYAMVGNYIDFGAVDNVKESEIEKLLAEAPGYELSSETFACLEKDLSEGQRMVFLTDNCGEIVMDKILLETIRTQYPNLEISVLVRGEPVLNDATMVDAEQIGLTKEFFVMGNGSGVAGTSLERISKPALDLINNADLVISKGQGNFETLRMCGKNIYYVFLCKCEMFAKEFGVPRFTGMIVNEGECCHQ